MSALTFSEIKPGMDLFVIMRSYDGNPPQTFTDTVKDIMDGRILFATVGYIMFRKNSFYLDSKKTKAIMLLKGIKETGLQRSFHGGRRFGKSYANKMKF